MYLEIKTSELFCTGSSFLRKRSAYLSEAIQFKIGIRCTCVNFSLQCEYLRLPFLLLFPVAKIAIANSSSIDSSVY